MSYKYQNEPPKYNKLYLNPEQGKLSGVCAGLADYLGVDTGIIRIATVLAAFFTGFGLIAITYIIMAWILEAKPSDLFESPKEDKFWQDVRTQPKNTIRDVRHKFREIERRLRKAEAHVTSRDYNLQREFRDLEK